MPVEFSFSLVLLLLMVLLSLLKIEKLVRMTFWSYVMMLFSFALASLIVQEVAFLQLTPDVKFLGFLYSDLASFLTSAQPTVILVLYALGLWFFTQSSHLTIRISSELFLQKMQTLLRAFFAIASMLCGIYFSLAYFKWAVYDWLFTQAAVVGYVKWIPLLALIVALWVLFSASQINIRFSFKKENPSPLL